MLFDGRVGAQSLDFGFRTHAGKGASGTNSGANADAAIAADMHRNTASARIDFKVYRTGDLARPGKASISGFSKVARSQGECQRQDPHDVQPHLLPPPVATPGRAESFVRTAVAD